MLFAENLRQLLAEFAIGQQKNTCHWIRLQVRAVQSSRMKRRTAKPELIFHENNRVVKVKKSRSKPATAKYGTKHSRHRAFAPRVGN